MAPLLRTSKIGTSVAAVTPSKAKQRRSVVVASLLSPEARRLAQLLRQLRDPATAVKVVQQCTARHAWLDWNLNNSNIGINDSSLRRKQTTTTKTTKQHPAAGTTTNKNEWIDQVEREIAFRIQCAWDTKTKSFQANADEAHHQKRRRRRRRATDAESVDLEDSVLVAPPRRPSPTTTIMGMETTSTASIPAPLICSDTEDFTVMEDADDAEEEYEDLVLTTNHHAASLVARRLDEEWAVMDFWGHLLEEVQLHVTAATLSRAPNITVTTTKQKKTKAAAVYQVFGLSGPTLRATPDDLPSIQQAVQREMQSYCNNGTTVPKQQPFDGRHAECRVYAVLQQESSSLSSSSSPLLWIQLNLGRPHDPSMGSWKATTTTASSSSSKPLQFVVAVQPESNLVAVSGARPRWIPCVVAVLEAALTCGGRRYYSNGGKGWDQHQDVGGERCDHLKGSDPCQLLREAAHTDHYSSFAVGLVATQGAALDPLTELHRAATEPVARRCCGNRAATSRPSAKQQHHSEEQQRRQTMARGSAFAAASTGSEAAARGACRTSSKQAKRDRNKVLDSSERRNCCKRSLDEEWGRDEDLTAKKYVRRDW